MSSLKIFAVLTAAAVVGCAEPSGEDLRAGDLQTRLEAVQTARHDVPGFAIAMVLPDGSMVSAATGVADPGGRAMTADTPVRQASITKTFVAAALLRLMEEGRLDLDSPIGELIDPEVDALLVADGYDTSAITVRQVMGHVAGLGDHFYGDAYQGAVLAEPERVWTPIDQLTFMVEGSDPLGAPNENMVYSDSGYVILGTILERITGQPMGAAVDELLKFDSIGLENVWWEEQGERPAGVPGRAHQFLDGFDTYGLHGTVDAHGGGGIMASVEDVAIFFAALFNGEVFDNDETLTVMIEAPGHPDPDEYRLGLFPGRLGRYESYTHSGFWGTQATAVPEVGLAFAGVALESDGYPDMVELMRDAARAAIAETP